MPDLKQLYDSVVSGDAKTTQIITKEALDGGALGLDFYERIIKEAPLHLKKEGWLVLEIGHDQAAQVRTITEETNLYEEYETAKDLAGKTRVFAARIKGKR